MWATVADKGNDELHKRLMKLENGTEYKVGPVISMIFFISHFSKDGL